METRVKTGVSLEISVFEAMEKARGLISRSAFVNKVIKNAVSAKVPAQPDTAASARTTEADCE